MEEEVLGKSMIWRTQQDSHPGYPNKEHNMPLLVPYWVTKRVGGPGCDKGFPEVGFVNAVLQQQQTVIGDI